MAYRPTMSERRVQDLKRWHERAYGELAAAGERRVSYLGLDLLVPATVFAPTPTSDLLGRAVLAEAGPSDRVLDMGTGSGVNAILAARQGAEVVGVDLNPAAVDAARQNADRNDVHARFEVSDIYSAVDGTFDLMIIDPPFRWFAPRDITEAAATDEGYRGVARFFDGVDRRLRPGGRILMFFGTSGDQDHVLGLADRSGLRSRVVASRGLTQDGVSVTYSTFRLERAASGSENLPQPRGTAG
ncbi:methyltransferase [Pseudonocardia nantongensis]|uniref:methyltransferase n=1 Tax=Pseudonocardia nantongensis TaxID=1181885 RepID=UPI00397C377E